ncbi:PAS domain-containing transcriptional regulator [Azospira inquinata]|uniref:LytTR family transcriptional regulator DNA-binding domain-containing protein n=1 Tax=Azospira inquinata TaxID=2785627 RepID=A0A975SPH4_9RHOO|nr:PAS domain-containing transcriptional regulator [Azospira inquinata]QWT47260.1 LytTR family transcriptional regulator DNA-binding domain-containing protein [Azospira inquinata]QWT50112.1 LytTR family transcriptional regulator DNA-binding domain-containing protein [Azospira inquinata]
MESLEYQLQKAEPGVVILDRQGRIRSANPLAVQVLGHYHRDWIGRPVTEFHPEPARRKIAWLLQEAAAQAPGDASPLAMMINVPDRPLLIKLTALSDRQGLEGFCLFFYDLPRAGRQALPAPVSGLRPLAKLPVLQGGATVLLDLEEAVHLQAEGHYARIFTARDSFLCHLSLAALERRLAEGAFLRVHRSHIIAMAYAARLEKEGDRQWVVMATFPASRVPISRGRTAAVAERLGLA